MVVETIKTVVVTIGDGVGNNRGGGKILGPFLISWATKVFFENFISEEEKNKQTYINNFIFHSKYRQVL
jgi:hypothetical protein